MPVKGGAVFLCQFRTEFLNGSDNMRRMVRIGQPARNAARALRGKACTDGGFLHRDLPVIADVFLHERPLARG